MTQQRRDEHSTEFGIWLRKQIEIDSQFGYVATNVDYIWHNYKSGNFMLIEEKRHGSFLRFPQNALFKLLDESIKNELYRGLHVLVFENTNPEDGKTILDGRVIDKPGLIKFLKFQDDPGHYQTKFYKEEA